MGHSPCSLRKVDGNLRISMGFKIGVSHKIFSDYFSIPSMETAIHILLVMECFTKSDLKSDYHQIQIDDKFWEITTINTPTGLLRYKKMPFWSSIIRKQWKTVSVI